MQTKTADRPRGISTWFWGVVAAVLTAGLVLSLLVMLYSLVTGAARRIHG